MAEPVAIWSAKIDSVKIFPTIGIARVGNSKHEWYYGPEIPGVFDEPKGGFKDANGAVKRQAARFRVYAFDSKGRVLGELNEASGYYLSWTVHVANKKAAWYTFMGRQEEGAFQPGHTTLRNPLVQPDRHPNQRDKLVIDSGSKIVQGPNAASQTLEGKFYGSQEDPVTVYLGETHTDKQGRLVVLAGRGHSQSVTIKKEPYPLIFSEFDSPDWVDDTCDGWVDVVVRNFKDQIEFRPKHKARVIGTTPKFTNGIYAPTTLYDTIEDVYEAKHRAKDNYQVGKVEWYKDIWPLLRCPCLLSWVNGEANGGHGPNGPGNFFDKKWQKAMKDTTLDGQEIRKSILGRIRLPEYNSKYDKARAGQAYPYFMPWLSGDNGDTLAGNASTFASITELQYDRLVKWSEGHFTVAEKPKYIKFSDIPVQEQPAALIKASLEHTVGAPLFPGIELSWNAALTETYNLNQPFTVEDSVQPGDLTKFLSLPWQSDFYQCRSYWWPSARPDSVVTQSEYNSVSKSFKPAEIAKKLTNRVPWERGIRQNYTDVYVDQPLFSSTDMAKNWSHLGFVSLVPESLLLDGYPIYVEKQRGTIPRKGMSLSIELNEYTGQIHGIPHNIPHGGGIILPFPDTRKHPITAVKSLQTHLQKAMAIELATIPLYLFAMYSVKTPQKYTRDPRYYSPVIGAIRGVVAEEMLHLSLAGNVLRAIGGTPKLYVPDYVPAYKMRMPGRVPPLWLELKALTREHLSLFIEIEKRGEYREVAPNPDEYHSLGQFYHAIMQGMQYLTDHGVQLFDPETAKYQFAPGVAYQSNVDEVGGSVIVTDLKTAKEALTTIIIQGEGSPGPVQDDPAKSERDHYDIFLDLLEGDMSWEVYPVRSNPTTYEYWMESTKIHQVSVAFDAAYCFLLLTIETLWTIDNTDDRHKLVLGNMFGIMMGVLAPLAKFLVRQPIGDKGEHAAPCFCFYRFKNDGSVSALEQVQEEMQAAIDNYVTVTEATQDESPVNDCGSVLETLLPIQASVNALIDLDTFATIDRNPVMNFDFELQTHRRSKGFARG